MAISNKSVDDPSLSSDARELRSLGHFALGDGWQYRLAQMEGVALKTVSRWVMDQRAVPKEVLSQLRYLGEQVSRYRLDKLTREIEDRLQNGLDRHVLAGYLTDLALKHRPVKTVPKDKRFRNKRKPKPAASTVASCDPANLR